MMTAFGVMLLVAVVLIWWALTAPGYVPEETEEEM